MLFSLSPTHQCCSAGPSPTSAVQLVPHPPVLFTWSLTHQCCSACHPPTSAVQLVPHPPVLFSLSLTHQCCSACPLPTSAVQLVTNPPVLFSWSPTHQCCSTGPPPTHQCCSAGHQPTSAVQLVPHPPVLFRWSTTHQCCLAGPSPTVMFSLSPVHPPTHQCCSAGHTHLLKPLVTGFCSLPSGGDHLVGLVVTVSASRAEDPEFESRLRRDFPELSHTSDLKIGTPVANLPGSWGYRVSAGAGWPSVSIL